MSGLPDGWTKANLSRLLKLNPKNTAEDGLEAGFSPMNLLGTSYRGDVGFEPRRWSEIKKAYTHFANGDVLLAKITPCFENGKSGIARDLPNGIGAGSSEYFVCRANIDLIDPRFLLAFFRTESFRSQAIPQMSGSVGHKRVPKDFLLNSSLPLPPLPEQKRIADKLDTLLARVDACREHLDRVPAILKRFRQSVLAAATSGKLTEEWRHSYGEKENWKTGVLGDLATLITKGASPKWQGIQYVDPGVGGTLFVTSENVRELKIDVSNPKYVDSSFDKKQPRSILRRGDLLTNIVGASIGRSAIFDSNERANINQAVCVIRLDESVDRKFVLYFLSATSTLEYFQLEKVDVARANLSLEDIRNIPIRLPSHAEQAEIVRRVGSLFALADELESRYTAARTHIDRLTPALLAKAFRGDLVPQDPNDEPAAALLARIAAQRDDAGASSAPRRGRKATASGPRA